VEGPVRARNVEHHDHAVPQVDEEVDVRAAPRSLHAGEDHRGNGQGAHYICGLHPNMKGVIEVK